MNVTFQEKKMVREKVENEMGTPEQLIHLRVQLLDKEVC